ncbi:MAG: stage III sporulation protein AC [Ruminococcaceae bacterium]|nr:stage III sporulation protein AC [Oscillospiraceae bacterium]MBQ3598674.1 stage III sporulation protein AC [Clostridia bacterium]MBR2914250.1 stage III sporulation protein AC [Clostridia bacterium]
MSVTLIIKIAGVGLLASVACQILQKSGKDEQATFVSIAGVITVMIMLISEISQLFSSVKGIFGL